MTPTRTPGGRGITIEQAKAAAGREVYYTQGVWELGVWREIIRERGIIESVNDRYVFVRYGTDLHSKATAPELLTLSTDALL